MINFFTHSDTSNIPHISLTPSTTTPILTKSFGIYEIADPGACGAVYETLPQTCYNADGSPYSHTAIHAECNLVFGHRGDHLSTVEIEWANAR